MKHFITATALTLMSLLCSCHAKLISTISSPPKEHFLVTRYNLPKKLMQVTATYTIQHQMRYNLLTPTPKAKVKAGKPLPKKRKYTQTGFDYYLITVEGDIPVKYWLEDDASHSYYLASDVKKGFTSTDITYVTGTHILKSLNSSLTPQSNQIAVGTLKFVTSIAASAIGLKFALDGGKPVVAKTDSVVIVETKTIPLMRIIDVSPGLFQGNTQPVEVALFNAQSLIDLNAIPADSIKAPIVRVSLSTALPTNLVTSAATTSQPATVPTSTAASGADGIVYRDTYPCTVLVSVTSYKLEDKKTSTQTNISRVSFPQLADTKTIPVEYARGVFNGKQTINITFAPDEGGIQVVSRSREKDVSTLLNQVNTSVQTALDAYEKRNK